MLTLPPQAYVYPETSTNERALANVLGKLNAVLRTGAPGQHRLTGHQFGKPEIGRPMAFATWASSLPAGEEILSIIPGPPGSAASLGKVLGNRTTLYKYLNPHIFAVTTASPNTCGVYVVDGAKGSIVYHTSIAARQGAEGCDLHATFVENWLVYVYWEEQYQWAGQTKGRRLVTVELYEGSKPDDKTRRCVSAFETGIRLIRAQFGTVVLFEQYTGGHCHRAVLYLSSRGHVDYHNVHQVWYLDERHNRFVHQTRCSGPT